MSSYTARQQAAEDRAQAKFAALGAVLGGPIGPYGVTYTVDVCGLQAGYHAPPGYAEQHKWREALKLAHELKALARAACEVPPAEEPFEVTIMVHPSGLLCEAVGGEGRRCDWLDDSDVCAPRCLLHHTGLEALPLRRCVACLRAQFEARGEQVSK